MTYSEFLQTPEWKELREKVRRRENDRCERCGESTKYTGGNAHHTTYRYHWLCPPQCLMWLCRPCHKYIEGISDFDPKAIPEIDELLRQIDEL